MVLAAAVLWGTVGPAQVLAGSEASPMALGGARLLGGGILLSLLSLLSLRGGSAVRLMRRAPWPLLAAAAATGIFQAAFFFSVARTGAALATAVALGVTPVATGIVDRMTGSRSPLGRAWLGGTAASVTGCALLLLPGGSSSADPLGVLLAVVAGVCGAVYTVAAKHLADTGADMVTAVSLTLLVGGVLFTPWLVIEAEALVTRASLLLIAWLALAATVLGYMLFVHGLRRIPASAAGTLSLAEPMVAAVLGLTVLGETLSPAALAGFLLLFGGLAAVALGGVSQSAPVASSGCTHSPP
ncbi:EamA family transporter [Nonomuraea sp. NPDC050663]|uniref:EamA family transporter n=1 Tax=Nonomuraea sp. NPDC050663 TaxID=3364370 RepID=UPI00379F1702